MKCALAVVLLLMSFVSVAFADGPDPIPPVVASATKAIKADVLLLADGPDPIPPVVRTAMTTGNMAA
jgi:hypothetical protein